MKKVILALLLSSLASGAMAQTATLSNRVATLEINLQGGGITSYALNDAPLNPFSWRSKWTPGCEGFFLCFDRIGQPSKEEKALGIPPHGEAHAVRWTVLEQSKHSLRVQCDLPLVKMGVVREYHLYPASSVCRITDRFKNNNSFEKPYNILLHPSLGPPFLDTHVLVDCNADTGFVNSKKVEELPGKTVDWPSVGSIDMHRMQDGQDMVVNYRTAPDVSNGWSCIANPAKGLLVGTLWDTTDYPWIRVWREWQDNAPSALGIEVGTSPLAMPFEQIEQVGDIMGLPTLQTLPPGGEVQKTFYLFLSKIPADYTGTENVVLESGHLVLEERSATRRTTLEYNTTP
jgi:hypothetical protein